MSQFNILVRGCIACAAIAIFTNGLAVAEDPAPKKPEAKPVVLPQQPVPAKNIQPGQPAQVKPGEKPAYPPPAAMQGGSQPVKPNVASDIPAPTVQLKEGEVPGVKFDTPTYEFGRVRSGQEIVHDFWFTNTGTGPLEILKVRPACGCTTAGQHDKIVQPGQTGKIPIRLNTGAASGPMHKTIMINTNCPGTDAAVTLHIQGEVWQPIQATPTSASFGRLTTEMASGSTMERKLTVVNNTENPIRITEAKCTNPSFKAEISTLEEGKKFELTVTIVPPLASGPVTGNVELTTTMTDMPKMMIPVNAYVTADVDVTPNQLTLPATRNGSIQRQFFIRNNTVNPVKVSEMTASSESLKLNIVETQPVGKAYRLTVDIPEDYAVATGGDKIILKTDNPSVPTLTIPINQAPTVADVSKQFSVKPGQVTPAAVGATATPGQPAVQGQPAAQGQQATPGQPQAPAQPQPAGSGTPAAGSGK